MQKPKKAKCSECSRMYPEVDTFEVDGARLCRQCLFGELTAVEIYPIGFVLSERDMEESESGVQNRTDISRIELLPSQKRFMYKLEEEEALTIVYYLHKSGPFRSRFRRRLDGKEVGVFASHTPHRLSPIGIQDVRLLWVKGTTLTVEGLDAFDGTPVLDIKSAGK